MTSIQITEAIMRFQNACLIHAAAWGQEALRETKLAMYEAREALESAIKLELARATPSP